MVFVILKISVLSACNHKPGQNSLMTVLTALRSLGSCNSLRLSVCHTHAL